MKTKKSKKEPLAAAEEKEEMVCVSSSDGKETICSPGGAVKKIEARDLAEVSKVSEKKNNLFIGTLNFFAAPYRGLQESYEKKYSGARKLFILDLVLLGVLGVLLGFNIYLFFSRTADFNFGPFPSGEVGGGVPLPEKASKFLTQIKINDQEELAVSPGEDLEYTIFYQNSGSKSLYDVSLKVNLEGAIFDFNNFNAGEGSSRDTAVVWTKDEVADFSELPPGKSGELKFKIGTVKTALPARVLKFGSLLKSWVETSYKFEKNLGESMRFVGKTREDKVNSDLAVQSLARYYTAEGDQLGRGPLPPIVGRTTKYWIFLSVENNLNDLSGVSVSADLPPNVVWTENVSVAQGELFYNSAGRRVTWKVGEVSRYTGEDWPKQGVAFEVSLVPTAEQVGSEAFLLRQIKIFGSDKFTDEFLEGTSPNLTTNLIYDALAAGKGKVAN